MDQLGLFDGGAPAPKRRSRRRAAIVLDQRESERLADLGTEAALFGHVGMSWTERAARWLALRREPFTSEDVVLAIGLPAGEVGTHKNNAVGALMRAWSRTGRIAFESYARARRVESHGARLTVWRPAIAASAA